jgi:hypothetical protein
MTCALKSFLKAAAAVAIVAAAAVTPAAALAGPITPGNLVVYRVGTGTGSLVNTGNPVFIDEYTTGGTLVQSIAMPTTVSGSNKQLIASGTASSEGMLTVSPNGAFVTVTGYATVTSGTASLSGTTSVAVNRSVGIITAATGAVDTTTALTNWTSGNNPRSAVTTNGTDIWLAGGASGVSYATKGATTATTGLTTLANVRQVNVFDGQLYASNDSISGGNTVILGPVGSGLPTAAGQTYTSLPGFINHTNTSTANAYSFFFADLDSGVAGLDTLYVADDGTLALTKYSLVSGNWVSNGTVGTDQDYRGITGAVTGTTVSLFATRLGGSLAAGGGQLVSLVDSSGYNGTFTGTPTVLATAGNNIAFRGVGIVPVPEPSTLGLAAAGVALAGLGAWKRRRRSGSAVQAG